MDHGTNASFVDLILRIQECVKLPNTLQYRLSLEPSPSTLPLFSLSPVRYLLSLLKNSGLIFYYFRLS